MVTLAFWAKNVHQITDKHTKSLLEHIERWSKPCLRTISACIKDTFGDPQSQASCFDCILYLISLPGNLGEDDSIHVKYYTSEIINHEKSKIDNQILALPIQLID